MVVVVDEDCQLVVEFFDVAGTGLGFEPFFGCLVEPFHFAAGLGVAWCGGDRVDTESVQVGFETDGDVSP